MHFKIDWASLIVRRFALFYFVFEGNFPSASRGGGGGAYTWRGLFLEFYGTSKQLANQTMPSPFFDLFIHWLIQQITNTY